MQLSKKAAVLLMSFFLLTGCEPDKVVKALPIPAERMDCVEAGSRPAIPPEYVIDWQRVENAMTVPEAANLAKSEVQQFKGSVRVREGTIAGYVLSIEGQLFACSNDAAWLREWSKTIAD